jgi:iron complex outermembrane receptor protein
MPRSSPGRLSRRAALRLGLVALVSALAGRAQASKLDDKQAFKISAGTAPEALAEFVRQSGFQVLFDFDAIRNFSTHAVNGQLEPAEALSRMFEGSNLTFEFINDRTIAVRPRAPGPVRLIQPGQSS